ncbi:MAG: sulfurtransferase [Thermomicrobiales bacterium]|nr:sulfurtransferase [Thermomicrobiales bacterium]
MATYANPNALVDVDWVKAHASDPGVRLVEVDVDTTAFDSGHIPGSIGWNWQVDLQQRPARDIPDQHEWEALLSRSGIGPDTTVILYGDNHNWFAAFAYWLFKYYGHDKVALLDGGRAKWIADGGETTTDIATIAPATYTVTTTRPELRAYRDDVQATIGNDGAVLIDVRSPGEYSGQLLAPENLPQEGAQRGGHVPGAQNVPWATAVDTDSTFKSVSELTSIYGEKGVSQDKPAIAYCRIGERSAHTWFVLTELIGVPDVRNYDGSWTEWGSLIGAPIEK